MIHDWRGVAIVPIGFYVDGDDRFSLLVCNCGCARLGAFLHLSLLLLLLFSLTKRNEAVHEGVSNARNGEQADKQYHDRSFQAATFGLFHLHHKRLRVQIR